LPRPSAGESFAYILLLKSSLVPNEAQPGHYRDDRSETVDLRVAVPSQFVRPHAQYGLLVRRLSKAGNPVSDNRPLHVGSPRPLSKS
jgi:hypothetical protein